MGQAKEYNVVTAKGFIVGRLEDSVGKRNEVGMVFSKQGARIARGGQCPDLNPGMCEQQAENLAAYIPAGAGHSYLQHVHLHIFA